MSLKDIELIIDRDESFNSITGLNGSGKSNILDSICFVLGITNMTTVRAQNLQVSGKPLIQQTHELC
jgi:chromosome segregation ATPase